MSRPEPPSRDWFTFTFPLRVRWAEVDRQEIVFNPHYFAYADIGVTEYFRAIGFPYPEGLVALGCDLYAVSATGNFHASAHYDDELTLAYRTAALGGTSLRFEMNLYRGELLLFDAALVYVNADPAARKPLPVPDSLRERILSFERVSPRVKGAAPVPDRSAVRA